jgi:hypothetical protein
MRCEPLFPHSLRLDQLGTIVILAVNTVAIPEVNTVIIPAVNTVVILAVNTVVILAQPESQYLHL